MHPFDKKLREEMEAILRRKPRRYRLKRSDLDKLANNGVYSNDLPFAVRCGNAIFRAPASNRGHLARALHNMPTGKSVDQIHEGIARRLLGMKPMCDGVDYHYIVSVQQHLPDGIRASALKSSKAQ